MQIRTWLWCSVVHSSIQGTYWHIKDVLGAFWLIFIHRGMHAWYLHDTWHDNLVVVPWSSSWCHCFCRIWFLFNNSIHQWLCSPFFGPGLFFGRTPWTVDQPVAKSLPTHRTTETQNKRIPTYMPWMGFEPTIPAFERAKTFHATVFCFNTLLTQQFYFFFQLICFFWS
jgi:hypothetical protein